MAHSTTLIRDSVLSQMSHPSLVTLRLQSPINNAWQLSPRLAVIGLRSAGGPSPAARRHCNTGSLLFSVEPRIGGTRQHRLPSPLRKGRGIEGEGQGVNPLKTLEHGFNAAEQCSVTGIVFTVMPLTPPSPLPKERGCPHGRPSRAGGCCYSAPPKTAKNRNTHGTI